MAKEDLSPAKRALLEKWLKGQVKEDNTGIPKRPLNSEAALSFPQQRQLFLELLDRGTAVNNLSVFLELTGKLNLDALTQSAHNIFERHEVLRTRFSFGMGLPVPEVLAEAEISIPQVDLTDHADQVNEARRLAEREVLQAFDLTNAPLLRLHLYELSEERHVLLIIVHHTIADGWSLGVFLKELVMFYQKNTGGTFIEPPALSIQYADFVHWQTDDSRVSKLNASMAYWKRKLGGELPVLELPTDRKRGTRQTFTGGTHRFVLSQELTASIEKLGRQEDATLFMTLLTAYYILLHRHSGQDDMLVGTPIANRTHAELEPLIGVFINTLVLRTNLAGEPGFRELLKRVRKTALAAYSHQDLPFEKLVEKLKPKRDLSRTPLFQVVFNLQNSPLPQLQTPALEIGFQEIDRGVSQFDMTLMISRLDGACHATVEYNKELFQPATIAGMFHSFQLLLEDAIAHPDQAISRLQILREDAQHHFVHELNQTQVDYPRSSCLPQLFEAQVERAPDAVAYIHEQRSITYDALNQRANMLARHLQSLGVGPGVRVGILMDKSIEIVEALLAVLKSGGIYVPIHTSYPADRVHYMLEDAEVKVLLTQGTHAALEGLNLQVVDLNKNHVESTGDTSNLSPQVSSDALAYVMYTSGSTGRPKGVMVQHRALVNFLHTMAIQPGIKAADVLLSVTAISFDIAALELYLPLLVGAKGVIASKEMLNNPYLMGQAIQEHQVNVMQATPATWQILLETGWKGDRGLKALCGGEALTRRLADRLLKKVGSLWNMYGPTETTIWSSICPIQPGKDPISIGHPIGNTQLYILDRYLQPVPSGVVGELHIGGEGLATGYLNRDQLTRERFIPDPFSSQAGARLYKTGDSARYLPDDSIEVLGRMDDQVKILGHRIEMGEIAAVILQHPSVEEAMAITYAENACEKRIVAYFAPSQGISLDANELTDFVRKKLPAYMVPTAFIPLPNFPLTANGKIDRNALPKPGDTRQQEDYVAPRNEAESTLVSIWQNVLEIDRVGIHDNFFDLGGASIQSLQIVAKANMFGYRISVEHIFEFQTIEELGNFIREELA